MQDSEQLYRQYAKTVYKYLISLTGSEDLAEELTQETFYQAIKSINSYDGSCRITTWLCAIAKNQLRTYRRKHPDSVDWEDYQGTAPSAEAEAEAAWSKLDLFTKLHSCPEPYREVLYMRLLGDLSFREIGQALGKTENWARVTYYRGKEKLRKELENHEK